MSIFVTITPDVPVCYTTSHCDVWVFSLLSRSVREMEAGVVIRTSALFWHRTDTFQLFHSLFSLSYSTGRSCTPTRSLCLVLFFWPPAPPSSVSLNKPQKRSSRGGGEMSKCRARFQSLFPERLPSSHLHRRPCGGLPTQNNSAVSSRGNPNTCAITLQLIRCSMTRAWTYRVICGHFMWWQARAHTHTRRTHAVVLLPWWNSAAPSSPSPVKTGCTSGPSQPNRTGRSLGRESTDRGRPVENRTERERRTKRLDAEAGELAALQRHSADNSTH